MLNYTTTTIVNSADSIYAEAGLFRVKFGPELKKDDNHHPILVGKQAYQAAQLAKITIDFQDLENKGDVNRIAIYIRLRNNNNPYFSNAWTFKGKPIYLEFMGTDDLDTIVSRAKKYLIAQYGYNLVNFSKVDGNAQTYKKATATDDTYDSTKTYYDKDGVALTASSVLGYIGTTETTLGDLTSGTSTFSAIMTASGGSTSIQSADATAVFVVDQAYTPNQLVITANDQWEIFMDQDSNPGATLEVLTPVTTAGTKANTLLGEVAVREAFLPNTADAKYVHVDNGNEAFGDFAHIVKDLRLPTDANRRWQGIAEGDVFGGEPNDDKPMPNGHYTQYTIQYTSDRGVLQQTALGGVGTSRTVHVFYVESAATSTFEAQLQMATITNSNPAITSAASLV